MSSTSPAVPLLDNDWTYLVNNPPPFDYQNPSLVPPILPGISQRTANSLLEFFQEGCMGASSMQPQVVIPPNTGLDQEQVLRNYFRMGYHATMHYILKHGGTPGGITSQPPPRAPKVADPVKYSGDQSKFRQFALQLDLKFSSDPDTYGSDKNKIIYAMSHLEGSALTWADSRYKNGLFDGKCDFDGFMKALGSSYDDPDPYSTAEKKIMELKQYQSCSQYYAQFLSYSSKLGWDDGKQLISRFKAGLKDNIKNALVFSTPPMDSLASFANHCIKLDNTLYARDRELTKHRGNSASSLFQPFMPTQRLPFNSPAPPRMPMPQFQSPAGPAPFYRPPQAFPDRPFQASFDRPLQAFPNRPLQASNSNNTQGQELGNTPVDDPMDLDAIRARKKPAPRPTQRRCYLCRMPGHYANNCPYRQHFRYRLSNMEYALPQESPIEDPYAYYQQPYDEYFPQEETPMITNMEQYYPSPRFVAPEPIYTPDMLYPQDVPSQSCVTPDKSQEEPTSSSKN